MVGGTYSQLYIIFLYTIHSSKKKKGRTMTFVSLIVKTDIKSDIEIGLWYHVCKDWGN